MAIFWHGGRELSRSPQIQASSQKRSEHGPGLYLTTNYFTACNYAKGGGTTYLVSVPDHLQFSDQTFISLDEAINFMKDTPNLRYRTAIINDILEHYDRCQSIHCGVLINLFVNYNICAGQASIALQTFLGTKGAQVSLAKNTNQEQWIVIHDLSILENVVGYKAKDVPETLWRLDHICQDAAFSFKL